MNGRATVKIVSEDIRLTERRTPVEAYLREYVTGESLSPFHLLSLAELHAEEMPTALDRMLKVQARLIERLIAADKLSDTDLQAIFPQEPGLDRVLGVKIDG